MQPDKPVWTIMKILEWTKQYFQDKGVENPRLDAEVLLCDVLKCQRINLYVHFDQPLEDEELKKYREYVQKRANHEPLAYILGHKAFMKNELKVSPDTLVPRPETELLVEELIKLNKDKGQVKILDLGCGSGAIVVSLLQELPEAVGVGVDIAPGAIHITDLNANTLKVDKRLKTICSDLFKEIPKDEKFNVIVSNPPYIVTSVIPTLAKDVQKEPLSALDGGQDGLDFYRKIMEKIDKYLEDGGLIAFEIGMDQGKAVEDLCKEKGFAVTAVLKDYAGLDRMVFASKEGAKYADEIVALRQR